MKQRAFSDNCFHRNEPMIRDFRYIQNMNHSRPISEIEEQRNITDNPSIYSPGSINFLSSIG